jgi:hypothetical protein
MVILKHRVWFSVSPGRKAVRGDAGVAEFQNNHERL